VRVALVTCANFTAPPRRETSASIHSHTTGGYTIESSMIRSPPASPDLRFGSAAAINLSSSTSVRTPRF